MIRLSAALAAVAILGACATSTPATRNEPAGAPVVNQTLDVMSAGWTVKDVRVLVPGKLNVSEANVYYPIADIVWREDPYGDRHAQVARILDDGLSNGLAHLKGSRQVYMDVVLSRFHSLTEKTRYSVGGVHNIIFTLKVTDAATGQTIYGPKKMDGSLKAFGGSKAVASERRGETQKIRILSNLSSLMRQTFSGGQQVQIVAQGASAPADVYTGKESL